MLQDVVSPSILRRAVACAALAAVVPPCDAHPRGLPSRGDCEALDFVAGYTPGEIDAMVAQMGLEAQLYTPAACGVQLYRLAYTTVAPDGSAAPASGGVA